jgi:hypothetical protein
MTSSFEKLIEDVPSPGLPTAKEGGHACLRASKGRVFAMCPGPIDRDAV